MHDGLTLDMILSALADAVAERVATRLDTRTGDGAAALRPRLFTVEQAAVYLGRSEEGARHLIASGRLPTVKMDRRVFIDVKDLDRLIEESKT